MSFAKLLVWLYGLFFPHCDIVVTIGGHVVSTNYQVVCVSSPAGCWGKDDMELTEHVFHFPFVTLSSCERP